MDRPAALLLRTLALGAVALAAVLLLGAFIEFLQRGRWPDQSVLRLVYEQSLISPYWFVADDWRLLLRRLLAALPVPVLALALAPPCWWLGGALGRR